MKIPLLTLMCAILLAAGLAETALADSDTDSIDRGRYLVQVGGCNDCHTPGYPESGGQVPESEWLIGVALGFNGPWGTSYPANLRLAAQRMGEQDFIARARSQMLPPMPWFNLVAMTDEDVVSIYRYIKSLGAAGEMMPAHVPPGQLPKTPYIVFVPTAAGQQDSK